MSTLTAPHQVQDAVYALAHAESYVYAARLTGLYRSADGGQTWQPLLESFDQPLAATAVAAAGSRVFAGVNGAVLCSEDQGGTWHTIGLASPPPQVAALALSPTFASDGVAIAGTVEDGVFISEDFGQTWVAWNFGLLDKHIYTVGISPHFRNDQTLYVGTESGIFRSHNGGRGWREVPFPMEYAPVVSLVVSSDAPSLLYAGTESAGLFISADGGLTWVRCPAIAPEAAVNSLQIEEGAAAGLWILLDDRLLFSADRGQTLSTARLLPPQQRALCFSVQALAIVGFADGTIARIG
jgi:photosystem II stability/assembly factor-like uncharacterized protein